MNSDLPKLNIGCGLSVFENWINIDASFTARLSRFRWLYLLICRVLSISPVAWPENIRIIDVRKGLPFKEGSVGAIFSSHMLEHVPYSEACFILEECYRCLHKGGVIRVIVPDLLEVSRKYVEASIANPNPGHSDNFLQVLGLSSNPYSGLKKALYDKIAFSRHMHMYDEESLKAIFRKSNFSHIQRKTFAESAIPGIGALEDPKRHVDSLCIEAVK